MSKRITIESGNIVVYITPMVFVHTINQWTKEEDEPLSFDVVNVYVDHDHFLARFDLGIILLGLGLSLKINYFDK